MTKTMTYVQALEIAIASVDGEAKERLEALKTSLSKKSDKKKASVDNTPYFEAVREALADGGKTPTELVSLIGVANTQKVASIVKAMGDEVVRNTKGKKVTYELA